MLWLIVGRCKRRDVRESDDWWLNVRSIWGWGWAEPSVKSGLAVPIRQSGGPEMADPDIPTRLATFATCIACLTTNP